MTETPYDDPVVYVVDDDPGVRMGLKRLLEAHGLRAECHASADDFLMAEPHAEVGCIVLDVCMPGTDGLALQQRLSATEEPYPVIFVSGLADVRDGVRAMKAGALDFLHKPVDEHELIRAVGRALKAREEGRRRHARTMEIEARLERLTPREREVMELVVTGLRNRDVGRRLGIRESTVKIHRGRVMTKMEVASLPDLVRVVERALGGFGAGLGATLPEPGAAPA